MRMQTSSDSHADVVVVGGGPAGAAAALTLTRAGCRVALLERSGGENRRPGETLPPEIRRLLVPLGAWSRFESACHLSSPGIRSVWGRSETQENDYLFNPYGSGWHIDRYQFDAMLTSMAQEAGAVFHRDARVKACAWQPTGNWTVEALIGGQSKIFHTEYLIEATGRIPLPINIKGRKRIIYDRLVGIAQSFVYKKTIASTDHRLLLESTPLGWWYSALLPKQRLISVFMTDADLFPRKRADLRSFLNTQFGATNATRILSKECKPQSDIHIWSANTFRRTSPIGPNYMVVGDGALAFDPLSSQGIYKALESAMMAATAIISHLQGDREALLRYAAWTEDLFARYMKIRAAYYAAEQRWPASVFWARRH